MKRRNLCLGMGAFLGMLILILDGKTALEGARQGLDLCMKTIIPALFPYFILSILLTSAMAGTSPPMLRPVAWLCGIPRGMESLLIPAFLGGYPAGAQSVGQAFRQGNLSKAEAERMLAFCSNAGPSFLFGIIAQQFTNPGAAWGLWGIHIVSALLTGILFSGSIGAHHRLPRPAAVPITTAMRSALTVTATVCGWVLLFRILLSFLNRWCLWLLPPQAQVLIAGVLELANGCAGLSAIADPRLRFLLCTGILAMGGVCVLMQTASVTEGLSLRHYLAGKLLQTLFSLILGLGVAYGTWIPALLLFPVILQKRRIQQNKGSIRRAVGV